jgi:hypothetical protein
VVDAHLVGVPVQCDHVQSGQVIRIPARADVALVAGRVGSVQSVSVAAHRAGDNAVHVVVVAGNQVHRDGAGGHGRAQFSELLIQPVVGQVSGRDHRRYVRDQLRQPREKPGQRGSGADLDRLGVHGGVARASPHVSVADVHETVREDIGERVEDEIVGRTGTGEPAVAGPAGGPGHEHEGTGRVQRPRAVVRGGGDGAAIGDEDSGAGLTGAGADVSAHDRSPFRRDGAEQAGSHDVRAGWTLDCGLVRAGDPTARRRRGSSQWSRGRSCVARPRRAGRRARPCEPADCRPPPGETRLRERRRR